ncbi:MAG TPA: hypothetical protein VN914_04175, partial [Polyangia bacterium]|nr:hypothetical protein [Polyangia bacterium]
EFQDSREEASMKWACHKAARFLGGASYLRETTGFGFNYDDWVDVSRLDHMMADGLAYLRARLAGLP